MSGASEGFSSPVVGGGGGLVYPSIHSPNYVLGITGWAIRKDGTAQFTGLVLIGGTFTGTNFVMNSAGTFFYSGTPATGNLIASIAPAAGTDSHSNAYLAGLTTYGNDGFGTYIQQAAGLLIFGNTTYPTVAQGAGAIGLQPNGALLINSGSTGGNLQCNQDGTVQIGPSRTLVASTAAGAEETWHTLSLVNGWTGTARYRLLPDGRVELDIVLSSAAATAAQFSTMPAGYLPAIASRNIAAGATANVAAGQAPYVSVTITGVIAMNGLAAFSAAGTWIAGGSYPLN